MNEVRDKIFMTSVRLAQLKLMFLASKARFNLPVKLHCISLYLNTRKHSSDPQISKFHVTIKKKLVYEIWKSFSNNCILKEKTLTNIRNPTKHLAWSFLQSC